MSVLDKIKGPHVEVTGWLLACAVNFLYLRSRPAGFAIWCLLILYIFTRRDVKLFNFLKGFAEPTTWPAYVTLGVIIVVAAYVGGWPGFAVAGAALMMNDGRTFDSLY